MNASDARRALLDAGFDCAHVEPVSEKGWASWTFEVDRRFIVRFPRDAAIVAAMHREMRLLPALASHVSFRVPEPVFTTDDWFVYERIAGRAFALGDDLDSTIAMIAELHSFPVEEARRLLGRPTVAEQHERDWATFSASAFRHLDAELVERVSFVRTPPALERECLIHDDLGLVHLLVDDEGSAVGMIDFEDATIGDPEVDLMPLLAATGRPLTERMWQYRCRSVLHDISYFDREARHDEIPAMVAELRRRLDLRPGQ